MRKSIITLVILLVSALCASAQKVSLSTDLVTWANLGTANLGISLASSRNITIHAEAQYNPWTFNGPKGQFQSRKQQYSLGTRWWPWHVYSGWWVGMAGQYQEYNRGGVFSQRTEEGDAVGLAISGGYTLMITPVVNIDFGLGLWGGYKWYKTYSCPRCGRILDEGHKMFFMPNDVLVALTFVF